jgi:hypothetical protein
MPNKSTRSESLTSLPSVSLEDVRDLISESQKKILSKLDNVFTAISTLEKRLDNIQAEQLRLGLEIGSVKDIIIKQQQQIEQIEAEKRVNNLVFSNIPEGDVKIDNLNLREDIDKVEFLCGLIDKSFDKKDISSSSRLGRQTNGHKRLLLVKFSDESARKRIFSSQKIMRTDEKCTHTFGRIFINKDSSILIRKEEKRMREKMRQLRADSLPEDVIFIKSGKLYKNSRVVDEIKVANQLF